MKKWMCLVLMAVMMLGACAAAQQPMRLYTDDLGRTVEIPQEIERIVPTGPLAQMVLLAIAPERFVGIASRWDACAEPYLDEACLNLPYLGQLYGSADMNVETLALSDPQLIIDIGPDKESSVEDLDGLEAHTGIPAVYIAADLATLGDAYRELGALLGCPERGETLAAFCDRVYTRTTAIMAQVGDEKVDALYVLGEKGLNVLAAGSYHAEVFDMLTNNLAVVNNPLARGTGNEVTMEQIALWNPPFVLFAPGSIYETAAQDDVWSEIDGIASGNYIRVPEGPYNWMGMPPASQRILALIWLTAELYPQHCTYDVRAEVKEYYELFYGCTLSDEAYDALTEGAFLGAR